MLRAQSFDTKLATPDRGIFLAHASTSRKRARLGKFCNVAAGKAWDPPTVQKPTHAGIIWVLHTGSM